MKDNIEDLLELEEHEELERIKVSKNMNTVSLEDLYKEWGIDK